MAEIIMPVNSVTPSTPSIGVVSLYPKADNKFYIKDSGGVESKILTDELTISSLGVNLPLTSSGGNSPTLSINPATTTSAGSLSALDKTKLNNATFNNVPSTIAMRDTEGKINATIIGNSTSCDFVPALTGHITTNGTNNVTTITSNTITNSMISNTADIELTKLKDNPLDRSLHTGTQLASTISDFASVVLSSSIGNLTDNHISNTAAIALSKLAVNPINRSNHTGTQLASTISDFNSATLTYLNTGVISNSAISNTAAIAINKLAVNVLDRNLHTGVQLSNTISDFNTAVNNLVLEGNGLEKTINTNGDFTLDVLGTSNRIVVSSNGVDISSNYVGQSSITTVGTITSGTWNGSTISLVNGGTGATTSATASINLTQIDTITSSISLTNQHQHLLVSSSSGNITLTLPAASTSNKIKYTIIKTSNDSNTITIAAGTSFINGVSNKAITSQYEVIQIICDGVNWFQF